MRDRLAIEGGQKDFARTSRPTQGQVSEAARHNEKTIAAQGR